MAKAAVDSKKLVKRLLEAKSAYYNSTPVMSDDAFDALEDELKTLDPDNAYFEVVGALGNNKTKIQHDVPMLSAGKAKTVAEAFEWVEKVGKAGEVILVKPKIDGLSATIKYKAGRLAYVATRGNGKVGQDISHVAESVDGIKSVLTEKIDVEIRGELYIPKNSKVPNPEGKPLRNMAVGFINRKGENHSLADLKWIRFGGYEVIGKTFKTEKEKMIWLEVQGFPALKINTFDSIKGLEKIHDDYLSSDRDKWEYETDGLVLTFNDTSRHAVIDKLYEVRHHHHYNIALKPPSVGKETELLGIEWNVSRQGKLIPVALVKPVEIGGATIQRCTLNNLENVNNLILHVGDRIIIERAGDVIPFFKRNITGDIISRGRVGAESKLIPTNCPSCSNKLQVNGIHLVCDNKKCKEQEVQRIIHWVKACEMEAFSESSVRSLYDAKKINNIKDLYSLTEKDFVGVDGFAKRKTENALQQIESTKSMNIRQFVDRLGIDLVGERAMEKLGIKNTKELLDFSDKTFKVGENLVDFISDLREWVKDLLACVDIVDIVEVKAGGKLVCMTGAGHKTRNELLADIKAKGDVFIDRVTKDVKILVCEDVKGGSTKLEKARKLGIKLMSYEEYFK